MLRACEFAGRLGFGIEARDPGGDPAPDGRELEQRLAGARDRGDRSSSCAAATPARRCSGCSTSASSRCMLPEAYAMVAASEQGDRRLRRIAADDRPPDRAGTGALRRGLLLAACCCPGILLRRDDLETATGKPISRHRLLPLVEETVGAVRRALLAVAGPRRRRSARRSSPSTACASRTGAARPRVQLAPPALLRRRPDALRDPGRGDRRGPRGAARLAGGCTAAATSGGDRASSGRPPPGPPAAPPSRPAALNRR